MSFFPEKRLWFMVLSTAAAVASVCGGDGPQGSAVVPGWERRTAAWSSIRRALAKHRRTRFTADAMRVYSTLTVLGLAGVLAGVVARAADPLPQPAAEGWTSEAFAEAAAAELKHLGEALQSAEGPALGPIVGIPCDVLRPADLTLENKDPAFVVRRAGAATGPRTTLSDALAGLRGAFSRETGVTRCKFKVIDVRETDRITRQFVSLFGPAADGGLLEINATWRVRWTGTAEAPVPAEVWREAHEETRHTRPEPLFADATDAVLPKSDDVRRQFLHGTDTWREQIEVFNRMYKFAYNGLALGDADGDGRDDLFSCQNGGLPNRLFLQQPDGRLRDATAESGLGSLDATQGALFLDLDNDGDQDLVTSMPSGLVFFENTGKARFALRARSPVAEAGYSLAAADFDRNGFVDIYVCRYHADRKEGAQLAVPVPYFNAENGGANYLVQNLGPAGNGGWLRFEDATRETGLDANNSRFSFAAVWDDLDGDGDDDLYVANDFGRNVCYLNDLVPGGRAVFREIAMDIGLKDGGFGMSAATGDFDRDGRRDLYVGNMFSSAGNRVTRQPKFRPGDPVGIIGEFQLMARGNSLFLGRGDPGRPRFDDASLVSGTTMGRWAWGSMPADLNNDGWEDLVVANGYITGRKPDDL